MSVAKFKKRVDPSIDARLFRRSALNIRDGAGVFDALLGGRKYKTILEIGTYRGLSAAYLSQFCDKVITIDLKHGRMERGNDAFDRQAFWAGLGITNIDLHLVDSNEDKARLIAGLDFDFAFIDGDHIAPGPAIDFDLVKRCGAVLFHDYDRGNDVQKFVDTLPREQIEIMDIFAFWRG